MPVNFGLYGNNLGTQETGLIWHNSSVNHKLTCFLSLPDGELVRK